MFFKTVGHPNVRFVELAIPEYGSQGKSGCVLPLTIKAGLSKFSARIRKCVRCGRRQFCAFEDVSGAAGGCPQSVESAVSRLWRCVAYRSRAFPVPNIPSVPQKPVLSTEGFWKRVAYRRRPFPVPNIASVPQCLSLKKVVLPQFSWKMEFVLLAKEPGIDAKNQLAKYQKTVVLV